ncbi:hypothetical protein BH09ACT10_BH09ACT10_15050 [soil metagenome]
MRVYVAATVGDLERLDEDGSFTPVEVYALSAALTSSDPTVSEEEWEYHLTYVAADASLELDHVDPRRVVIVAETDALAMSGDDPARVAWEGDLSIDQVVAFLVDVAPDGEGIDYDDDLAWFATQELSDLI